MRPQDPVHSPFLKRQERLVARVKNTYRFSLGDQFLGFARATYPLSFYWIISFLLPVQVWIRKCLHFCFYIDLTWTALCVNWTCFCYCLQRANESFVWFRGFSAFHRFLWILRRELRTQADVRLAFCQCSALARRVGGVFEQLHLLISVLLPDFGVLWTFSWRWASVLVAVSFYQHDPSFARVYSFCRSLVPCFEILPSFSRRNRRFSVAQPSVRRRRTLWCVAYSVRVCVCASYDSSASSQSPSGYNRSAPELAQLVSYQEARQLHEENVRHRHSSHDVDDDDQRRRHDNTGGARPPEHEVSGGRTGEHTLRLETA